MPPKMKTTSQRNKFMVIGLALMVFALMASLTPTNRFTTPTAAAQQQTGCPLEVTASFGDPNFTGVPAVNTTVNSLSIAGSDIDANQIVGGIQSVTVTPTNASVLVSNFVVNQLTPVTITAAATDPTQPASFSVLLQTRFHQYTVSVNLDCPLPPQETCPLSGTVTGATGAITATFGPSGVSISLASGNPNGIASVVASNIVNANVVISPFVVGQTTPVSVSATKINPNQLASFTLTASDTFNHAIVANISVDCPIPPSEITGCTYTQGYWKNHEEVWPVQSLTLGTVNYTKAQLLSILRRPVRGNGLISLSHQLIAAKLNAATGATVPAGVANAIAAADALIGGLVVPPVGGGSLSTSATSALTSTLDQYNNGLAPGGPGHCD